MFARSEKATGAFLIIMEDSYLNDLYHSSASLLQHSA